MQRRPQGREARGRSGAMQRACVASRHRSKNSRIAGSEPEFEFMFRGTPASECSQ